MKQKDVELSERALRLAALQERVQQLEHAVQERDKAALELQSRLAGATNENERLELALTAEKGELVNTFNNPESYRTQLSALS